MRALIAVTVVGLAACASEPLQLSAARFVQAERLAAAGPTSIVVRRDTGGPPGLRSCRYSLFVDGGQIGTISYGEAVRVYPAPGRHILSLKTSGFPCNSGDSELAIDLPTVGEAMYRIAIGPDGKSSLQPTAF